MKRALVSLLSALGASALLACASTPAVSRSAEPARARATTDVGAKAGAEPSTSHCSTLAQKGAGDLVGAVDLRGQSRLTASDLCPLLATRAGGSLDDETLASDVRTLYGTGQLDDIVVSTDELATGRRVLFTVRERPLVRKLVVLGVKAIDDDDARAMLVPERAPFDGVALREGIRKLRDEYLSSGYRSADVQFRVDAAPEHEVDVTVDVREGAQARIDAIHLDGASKASEKDLLALVDTDEGHYNRVGAPYRPETFERALLYMSAYYWDRGRVQAKVSPAEIVPSKDGSTLAITVRIEEGPVFRLGKIRCKGDFGGTPKECLDLVGLKTGDVFSRAEMVKAIDRIRAFQIEKGRGTTITPGTELDPKKRVLNLDLQIDR